MAVAVAGQRIGPYEILGELGRGGMGAVYRVRRADLDREFALKVMLRPGDESAAERFLREAKTAAALADHPGIVAVHDVGEAEDGTLYLAMDLVDGDPLDALIDENPPPPKEAARVVEQAARAVAFAHARGVLHRDIKPANILVNAFGDARVTDFGLASRAEDTRLTKSGEILGTPAYMPPEQAAGDCLDERADVWSLGATLYECLAGRPPFDGSTALNVLAAVMTKDPRRIVGAPRDLEAVVMKCLEKDPARRYPSALALAQDLGRFVSGEPVAAKPVGPVARWARRVRRRPLPWVVGAVAVAVAATAGLWTWHQGVQRQAAVQALQDEAEAAAARFRGLGAGAAAWEQERAYGAAQAAGAGAIRLSPDSETQVTCARLLADLAAERLATAEQRLDAEGAGRFLADLRQHGAESHAALIQGDGVIVVPASDPQADYVEVARYTDFKGRLDPNVRLAELGAGEELKVPMGSYLLMFRKEGYPDTLLPVLVERGEREVPGRVRLLTDAEIGDGFVYVPAGESVVGGDPESKAPFRRARVGGFLISSTEVTFGEYRKFLESLVAARDREGFLRHVPTPKSGRAFGITDGVVVDAPGMNPDWPVLAIKPESVEAYCAWRSRVGRTVRLPTPDEWERAARGADGRQRPWGDGFDWSWAVLGRENGRQRRRLADVGSAPVDMSPFGVLDMLGSVAEVCAGRKARGATWSTPTEWICRLSRRGAISEGGRSDQLGFRLAADLPERK